MRVFVCGVYGSITTAEGAWVSTAANATSSSLRMHQHTHIPPVLTNVLFSNGASYTSPGASGPTLYNMRYRL